MKVGDICTREVVTTDATSTVQQAAGLMRERHVGALLVVGDSAEGKQVVGVVTDRDLVVEALARGLDAARTGVGRFAEGKIATIAAQATIGEAIAAMKERAVRRLLVADEAGRVYGIVSLDDVLGALGHELAALASAVQKGVERESAERAPLPPAPGPLPGHIRIPLPYPLS